LFQVRIISFEFVNAIKLHTLHVCKINCGARIFMVIVRRTAVARRNGRVFYLPIDLCLWSK